MKILVVGDFHGKFPKKLKSVVKKEKIDLIVSLGDYMPFSLRKEFFKYGYKKDIEVWEIIGKKKVKENILRDLKKGEKIIAELNKLNIPTFTTIGNIDYTRVKDSFVHKKYGWKWESQDFFSPIIKKYKNVKKFDYSFFKFSNFVFIGAYGSSSPGQVKSKAYKRYKKKLDNLFKKFKKENKDRQVIFVSHNVPYNTKLDLIKAKDAHKIAKGKHYGSKLVRRTIDKWQPALAFGGHIHESWGKDKIGKTIVINPGAAVEGKFVIVDINEQKRKIKNIRFVK